MSLLTQKRFADALLDHDAEVPSGLRSWNLSRPERRFAVYRNNVVVGLIGALASRFPATQRIVGETFFAGMARVFIAQNPPRSPLLLTYGDDFGDFATTFKPVSSLPYLADVIRLEAARGHAYHAADRVPLDPVVLARMAPEQLLSLTFELHPSASVLRSPHPIVTIWAMNSDEIPLAPIDDAVAEDALVIRPHMIVQVQTLPPGGAAFIEALMSGNTLGEAFGCAMAEARHFDMAANLAGILQAGLLINLH